MKRKILLLAALCVSSALVITACGKKEEAPEMTEAAAEAEPAAEEKTEPEEETTEETSAPMEEETAEETDSTEELSDFEKLVLSATVALEDFPEGSILPKDLNGMDIDIDSLVKITEEDGIFSMTNISDTALSLEDVAVAQWINCKVAVWMPGETISMIDRVDHEWARVNGTSLEGMKKYMKEGIIQVAYYQYKDNSWYRGNIANCETAAYRIENSDENYTDYSDAYHDEMALTFTIPQTSAVDISGGDIVFYNSSDQPVAYGEYRLNNREQAEEALAASKRETEALADKFHINIHTIGYLNAPVCVNMSDANTMEVYTPTGEKLAKTDWAYAMAYGLQFSPLDLERTVDVTANGGMISE